MTKVRRDLNGVTVLLQVVPYFGYDKVIADALRKRGATVDMLADRPFQSAFMHGVAKLARPMVLGKSTSLYRAQLATWSRARYDYILVINGQTMSESFLRELKSTFPTATLIFYIWDSFENKPYAVKSLNVYDRCFSFDRKAAEKLNLGLRPLFYSPDFDLPAEKEYSLDISFVGSAHSDRPAVLSRLDRSLPSDVRRLWFLYLKANWVLAYRKLTSADFRGVDPKFFSSNIMPRDDVRQVFADSATFLDIEHDRQSGLTIRTFEAIGTRRKLVTTNNDVQSYDFYDPVNIKVIDRKNPKIDKSFFVEPIQELDALIRHKYSVDGWIDDVFGLNK
jgi:hypothetical protein